MDTAFLRRSHGLAPEFTRLCLAGGFPLTPCPSVSLVCRVRASGLSLSRYTSIVGNVHLSSRSSVSLSHTHTDTHSVCVRFAAQTVWFLSVKKAVGRALRNICFRSGRILVVFADQIFLYMQTVCTDLVEERCIIQSAPALPKSFHHVVMRKPDRTTTD